MPEGATWHGSKVTVTADDVLLENWKINRITGRGARCMLLQCEIEDAGSGGADYPVNHTGINWTLQNCDLYGDGTPVGSSALVVSGAAGTTLRMCHLRDHSADGIKLAGMGCLVELNRFGRPENLSGVVPYDSGVDYPVGSFVRYSGDSWKKRTSAPAGTTPVEGADWTDPDPHVDQVSIYGGSGVFRYNAFDQVTGELDGPTQQIRIVRNTGSAIPIGDWIVYGNVFQGWPGGYPLSAGVVRAFTGGAYKIGEYAANDAETVFFRAIAQTATDPAVDPTDWVEDRDLNVSGQVFWARNWIEEGVSGLYNSGIGPVATYGNTNGAGESILNLSAQPRVDAPRDVGADLAYTPPVRHGPAQVFTITPTAFTGSARLDGVTYDNVVAIRVGVQLAALIDIEGYWYVGALTGVSVQDNGDGTFTLRIYDSSGNPMGTTVTICAGAALVTTGADEGTTGNAWGAAPKETDTNNIPNVHQHTAINTLGQISVENTSLVLPVSVDLTRLPLKNGTLVVSAFDIAGTTNHFPSTTTDGFTNGPDRVYQANGSRRCSTDTHWKFMGALPDPELAFMAGSSASGRGNVAVARAFDGVASASFRTAQGNGSTPILPSVAATEDNSVVLMMAMVAHTSGAVSLIPADGVNIYQARADGGTIDCSFIMFEQEVPAGEYTPPALALDDVTNSANSWVAVSILLTP